MVEAVVLEPAATRLSCRRRRRRALPLRLSFRQGCHSRRRGGGFCASSRRCVVEARFAGSTDDDAPRLDWIARERIPAVEVPDADPTVLVAAEGPGMGELARGDPLGLGEANTEDADVGKMGLQVARWWWRLSIWDKDIQL